MIELIRDGEYHTVRQIAIIVLACWVLMVLSILIDLWTGTEKAKAIGEKIDSGGLRRTFIKAGEYWRVLCMMLFIDITGSFLENYDLPYATMLGVSAVILIECKSVIENLRAKKSAAGMVPDMIKEIIECKDIEKAIELISNVKKLGDEAK